MSSISRWNLSGGGEDGMPKPWGRGVNYTPTACSRRGLKQLQKVTLHPALEVVIFRFDLAPWSCGNGLVVACEQDAGAFAQYPSIQG